MTMMKFGMEQGSSTTNTGAMSMMWLLLVAGAMALTSQCCEGAMDSDFTFFALRDYDDEKNYGQVAANDVVEAQQHARELQGDGALLDLYVRVSQFQTENPTRTCNTCDGNTTSCFSTQRHFVEQECYRAPGERARTFQGNETRVCRTDYPNNNVCDDTLYLGNKIECINEWPTDECVGDYDEMMRFPDWCIRTNEPRDDYVVPMVHMRLHETEVFCQANIQSQDFLVPDDPMLCNAAGVTLSDGTVVRGGRINYCDGDVLRIKYFSDESCTEQVEGASIEHLDQCSEQPTELLSKGSCGSPATYYCKNLYNSKFGSEVPQDFVPAPTPAAPKPALDLYVRQSHLLLSNEADTETFDECPDGCGYEDDNCFHQRMFDIQGECFRSGDGLSKVFQGDFSTICRMNYNDEECQALGRSCAQIIPVDVCEDSNELSRYEDWCIKESEPRDEYVVPMVRAIRYDDMASCMADINAYDGWAFADRSFCQQSSVVVNGVRQVGSYYGYCDGDVLTTRIFSDGTCSEQVDGMAVTELKRGMECTEQADGTAWKSSCNSPTFFCRNLYNAEFGFELIETPMPTMAPVVQPQGDSTTTEPTMAPAVQTQGDSTTMKPSTVVQTQGDLPTPAIPSPPVATPSSAAGFKRGISMVAVIFGTFLVLC